VRPEVGVVADRAVLHAEARHEPDVHQRVEDVVDRGAGEDRSRRVYGALDLIGGRVAIRPGQVGEHRQPRLGHPKPAGAEQALQCGRRHLHAI
jgi:hypothetical protein